VLVAQVDHMRSRGALRSKQEEPIEMFTALIAGFQDDDGIEDDEDADKKSAEATFCFLSSGNSVTLANKVIDWFERRFDCYVETFDAVPITTMGLLATRWSVMQPPGNPLDPERTLSLTLAPPAESAVRGVDAITVLVPLAAVVSAILDKKHAQQRRRPSRSLRESLRSGDESAMDEADALLVDDHGRDSLMTDESKASARADDEEADDDNWDALDLVDDLCSDMLGLDVHKLTLAEFKTPVVALSSDGFLEIREVSAVLQVLEDIAGELLLPLTNSSVA